MKKTSITILGLLPLLLTSCWATRIVTVSPGDSYYGNTGYYSNGGYSYTTTVTAPRTHAVTTTTATVNAIERDLCLQLDLQAVAGAFAQSSSVREFESLLNNSSYIISNLDIDGDGYVDYLRVLETIEGYNHVFLIQAVLGHNMYQDVATIVVENPNVAGCYVEIIGSPFIYGRNYIVRPNFINRPYIFTHICRHGYSPWMSPYYWDHFPSYYRRPAPVFVNHYQAYVNTYITNNYYCNGVHYSDNAHYGNYERVCSQMSRNDYGQQHPERSFTVRNANTVDRTDGRNVQVTNARGVRAVQEASKTTNTTVGNSRVNSSTATTATTGASRGNTTATTGTSSRNSSSATTGTNSRNSSSAATTTSGASRGNTTATSGTTSRYSSGSSSTRSSSGTQSTINSRVSSSGQATTTRSSSSGSSTRSSSASSSSRSSSTSSSSSRSSGAGSSRGGSSRR